MSRISESKIDGLGEDNKVHGVALLALAGFNVSFGALFPLTKPALETIPPFTFALLRFLIAMIILLPFACREALGLLKGPDGMRLALIGLLGFCIAQVAQTLALKMSTASDISLLQTISPIWIALLARIWLDERLNRLGGLGFLLGIAGLILIVWPKDSGGPVVSQRVIGDAIFMVTGFTWACYTVMGKAIMERHAPLPATAAAGIVGTSCIVPFTAYELLSGNIPEFTLVGAAGVAYAGIVTALGFLVFFWALARVRATIAGIMMYLQPLAGVLLAWLLLHERPGVEFMIGAVLVLSGVYLVTGPASE